DPRRHRQPARLARRQFHRRHSLYLRPGQAAGARLLRSVPPDGPHPRTAPTRPVRQAIAMNVGRIALWMALLLLATLPFWLTGIYYINVTSQILIYAIFALALNVLIGHGGLVSLGHAGLFGLASYACAIAVQAHWGHPVAIIFALLVTLAG